MRSEAQRDAPYLLNEFMVSQSWHYWYLDWKILCYQRLTCALQMCSSLLGFARLDASSIPTPSCKKGLHTSTNVPWEESCPIENHKINEPINKHYLRKLKGCIKSMVKILCLILVLTLLRFNEHILHICLWTNKQDTELGTEEEIYCVFKNLQITLTDIFGKKSRLERTDVA